MTIPDVDELTGMSVQDAALGAAPARSPTSAN